MSWLDRLKPCPEFKQPAWARVEQNDAVQGTVSTVAALKTERKLDRKATKHRTLHLLHVANAAQHLDRLPDVGESFHCVMRGNYNAWDLVPAVLKLAGPARIDVLHVATLGFSDGNAAELLDLLDTGRVGAVTFLCSHYFRGTSQEIYDPLAAGLLKRGQKIAAARSHAKVLAFALADGRRLVVESSANLRSCRNVEQFCMTHDAGLYDFHRQWIEEVTDATAAEPPVPAPERPKSAGAYSQKRAGLGVWSVTRTPDDREPVIRWKSRPEDPARTADMAERVAGLIRQWSPRLPADACITVPPQGASSPGHYFAAALARAVAGLLRLPFRELVTRTDDKRHHHPHAALKQSPFVSRGAPPFVIVVDDIITSGATMRLTLDALRQQGATAFGFAFAGC